MASLPPGTLLGQQRYTVIRELNRGGTAVVYEALDNNTNAHVALKVMNVSDGRTSLPARAVRREIEYGAALRGAHVVQLLDYFADGERLVIVWELIQGPDLLDFLNSRGGRLDEAAAARYFAQVVEGLRVIHAHGLAHRDIKPENCVIDSASDTLKIIDFGLSKGMVSAVTLGVGTPDYMAPEMLGGGDMEAMHSRRTGAYNPAAVDVWACGVLLALLVTGQYIFEDAQQPSVTSTLRNIALNRRRSLPRHLSPALLDLIECMLRHDASARITLEGIQAHPWLAAPGSSSSSSSSAGSGASSGRGQPAVPGRAVAVLAAPTPADSAEAVAARLGSFHFEPLAPAVPGKSTPHLTLPPHPAAATQPGSSSTKSGAATPTAAAAPTTPVLSRSAGSRGGQQQQQGRERCDAAGEGGAPAAKRPRWGFCSFWPSMGAGASCRTSSQE